MSKLSRVAVLSLLVATISTFVTSCEVPTMVIQTSPRDALVWIDGRAVFREEPGGEIESRRAYYGTTLVHSRQAGALRDEQLVDLHHRLHADEPFTPWIFPFDFILEVITLPFSSDRYRYTVDLQLPPRKTLVSGKQPPDLLEMRDRARKAVLAR